MLPQEQRFVDEFLIDLNGAQAAIRAGYSEKTAKEQACRLLTRVHVATAVSEALQERAELTKINAGWVLKRAALLADFNIEDFIVHVGSTAYYDFSKATRNDWYCISEYTTKTVKRNGELIPVEEIKIKSYCKLRALELVGKHVNVQAFKDQVEHSGTIITKVERTIVDPKTTDS